MLHVDFTYGSPGFQFDGIGEADLGSFFGKVRQELPNCSVGYVIRQDPTNDYSVLCYAPGQVATLAEARAQLAAVERIAAAFS